MILVDSGLWGGLWLSSTGPCGGQGRGNTASGVREPERQGASENWLCAGCFAGHRRAHRDTVLRISGLALGG